MDGTSDIGRTSFGKGYKAPLYKLDLPPSIDPNDSFRFSTSTAVRVGEGFERTTVPQDEARHLPGYVYWHPEVLRLEREKLFMRDWMIVGRVEEVEFPGDYMTMRILGEPIIIARDENGQLNAFYNRCAHRGVAVVAESGNAQEFSCPYHAWLYDLRGNLVSAPFMKHAKNFDTKACGLKPVALRSWGGWIYVSLAEHPPSFEEYIADFAEDFGFLRMQDCRLGEKFELTIECNWKFVIENVMDNYHTPIIHRGTIGRSISTANRYGGKRGGKGAFTAFYSGGTFTEDEKTRFRVMPWIEDRGEMFACSGHMNPNAHLFGRCDHIHVYVIWPIHPTKSKLVCYQIFPDEFFADNDFAAKVREYTLYNIKVLKEDTAMIDSIQDAAYSTNFTPGRMSEKELGVYNVINETLARTFDGEPTKA